LCNHGWRDRQFQERQRCNTHRNNQGALISISPSAGTHGTTVPVTLTGTNLTGATAVTISGGGITCTGITSTATTVNASCSINAGAARSARNVSVTTPIGATR